MDVSRQNFEQPMERTPNKQSELKVKQMLPLQDVVDPLLVWLYL